MPLTRASMAQRSHRNGGALMKVLIGVDPHKASLAVAALEEATGELLERASFPRRPRWVKVPRDAGRSGSHSVVGRWRTLVASVGTWQRSWQRPVSRWSTCLPSSRQECVCSLASLETPARTTDSMPWPPRWPPRATTGWRRSSARPHPRRCACFPRDEKIWLQSAPERSTACTGSLGTSSPEGWPGGVARTLSADRAARILRSIRPKQGRRLGTPAPAVGL